MTSTAKTIVISGGTDGMGRALASTYLGRGDTVVIIGRDAAKAATLPGAHFIPADLSLVSENRRVLKEINDRYPAVDALVLCARYFRSSRFVTAEGVEGVFALEYLSRFLLSHGLDRPRVIVNVSGPTPGVPTGRIHWDGSGKTRWPGTRRRATGAAERTIPARSRRGRRGRPGA
ncbi:hypothetical protein GCM10010466_66690 [Planomonospora alba]|uniref:SDR family NAD(P)-dependent oxidoreductase n=1 Tax=Planomonospora alba TaxID=161354 RepID=A0ABP6P3T7_9ACTN